jgi:hypothetical protein
VANAGDLFSPYARGRTYRFHDVETAEKWLSAQPRPGVQKLMVLDTTAKTLAAMEAPTPDTR